MLKSAKKAFLFDLNGTMIDDMQYHIIAWHGILNELGGNLSLQRVKEECYGKNHELLERVFPGRFSEAEKNQMSFEKEKKYQQQYRPHLALLPGLENFLLQAKNNNIPMAIGSAAIMFNIDFVLDNLGIRDYFDVLVSADHVDQSKPHPETWLQCAEKMKVSSQDCIVFEDSPKGVQAAWDAGMQCVVLTTLHQPEEFGHLKNIIAFVSDYNAPDLFEKCMEASH